MDRTFQLAKEKDKKKKANKVEHRALLNKRMSELRELVKNVSFNNKTTQDEILKRAHVVVTHMFMELSGNWNLSGTLKGLDRVQDHTISFFQTLKISDSEISEYIHDLQMLFKTNRDIQYGISSVSTELFLSSPLNSAKKIYLSKEEQRKGKKREKERYRRARLLAGFAALKEFVDKNKLADDLYYELGKREILEIIIEFIRRNKNNNQLLTHKNQVEYSSGFFIGQQIAKDWATQFFQASSRLGGKSESFLRYFEMNLKPKQVFKFPQSKNYSLIPNLSSYPQMSKLLIPQQSIGLQNPFLFLNSMIMPVVSPFSSDSSGFSSPTCSNDERNVPSSAKQPVFFRPWL